MTQTAQIRKLRSREDLGGLLPGDVVEIKGGVTGEKILYAFEGIFYDEEEHEEIVSFLNQNSVINRNLRIPQKNFVIDDGCVCYVGHVSGDWLTKYFPGDEKYKNQRRIIEQAGL